LRKVIWRSHFVPLKYKNNDDLKRTRPRTNSSKLFNETVKDFLTRLSFARKNEHKLERPKWRRVKSYPCYKLFKNGNKIVKMFKRCKLSEFKTELGINKTNRVIGWTPDYVGASKSKSVKAKNYFYEFINNNFDEIDKVTSDSFTIDLFKSISDHRVVYSAGYDTSWAHLKEIFKDNQTTPEFNRDGIIDILSKSDFKWFPVFKTSFYNCDELYSLIRINPNAFSGHYTSKFVGKLKGESDLECRNVAEHIHKRLRKEPIKNVYLWSILGREKDIKIKGEDKEVGTRVIMTNEAPPTILNMWFAQKLSLGLNNCNYPDKTFHIIDEYNGEKSNNLYRKSIGYDWELEADFSYFDSNMDTDYLEIAGSILTMGLPNDNLHKNISHYITSSFTTKYVVLPPGIVIELNRSLPSGTAYTTLVNCIVNTIYWCLIGYKIYGDDYHKYMSIEVYGDDAKVFFKHNMNIFNIDRYVSEIGIKSEPLVDNLRSLHNYYEKHERIDFLKRRDDVTNQIWNHKKMFDRIFYQMRNRKISDQINLIYGYYNSCKLDKDVFQFTKMFINYVKDKHSDEIDDYETRQIVDDQIWVRDFNEVTVEDKHYYHHKSVNPISNFNKYMDIYRYGKVISKNEILFNNKLLLNRNVPMKMLILLSHNFDDVNGDFGTDFEKLIRDPPLDLQNKRFLSLIRWKECQIDANTSFIRRKIPK